MLQNSLNANERESEIITVLKSLAIILVVLQHSLSFVDIPIFSIISKICYAIDVNVFFFISGYLFECKKDNYLHTGIKTFLSKKTTQLVVPYLFYSSILYFIVCIGNSIEQIKTMFESIGFSSYSLWDFIINTITYRSYYVEMYWFIYVLFVIFMVEYVRTTFRIGNYIWMVIVFISFSLVEGSQPVFIVLKLSASWMVFICGRMYAEHKYMFGTVPPCFACASFIIFVSIMIRRNIIAIPGAVPRVPYYMFYNIETMLLGVCSVLFLSFIISRLYNREKTELFKYLGVHSYSIYLLHNPYIVALVMTGLLKLHFPIYASVIIAFIFGVTVPCLLERILEKNSVLSVLFLGRKSRKGTKNAS